MDKFSHQNSREEANKIDPVFKAYAGHRNITPTDLEELVSGRDHIALICAFPDPERIKATGYEDEVVYPYQLITDISLPALEDLNPKAIVELLKATHKLTELLEKTLAITVVANKKGEGFIAKYLGEEE